MTDRHSILWPQKRKQEANGITIGCFFVWQFMVHSMIYMSDQPGIDKFSCALSLKNSQHLFTSEKWVGCR